MAMQPGQKLLHYELAEKIGEGGMGVVWRARDTKLDRDVALKVLPPEMISDPDRLVRFRREARAIAALNHRNIVTIYAVEDALEAPFMTMELVEGRPLDRSIPDGGLPVERLLSFGRAIAEALAAAHAKGIVHRDLKPANVIISDDGVVKVLDFGLAKDTRPLGFDDRTVSSAGETAVGVVMGTPAYMSPEQTAGRVLDHRTDLFSLGVLLYEMTCGRRPFNGDSTAELFSAILRDPPPPLGELRDDLPGGFVVLVEQCLAKKPDARPSTAREIIDRLTDVLAGDTPTVDLGIRDSTPAAIPTGNLPESVDSFVAREHELAEVVGHLSETRLVTLVGVGGTGKTRLAIESARRVAERFDGGAWLVELAPVTVEDAVPHVLSDLLGIVQQPNKSITQSVVESLKHRSMLLVLDNCEHLLDAAADLSTAITTQCANVRLLATSRENLAIRGEQVVRLQSLSDEQGAELFRDRARTAGARGEFDMGTLTRLSERLDGMPLAIELAAARSGTMSPEEIERRLGQRFRLLRGSRRGRMERHQTLRSTVAWSYDLLEPLERNVFDRLSVFAGGFDLEAAREIARGEHLDEIDVEDAVGSLVTRSMVLATDTEDGTRYRLLETLRQFGEEQLVASGGSGTFHERHVLYFADFMTRAWAGLWGPDDARWIRVIGREFENLRLAVYTAIDREDREALGALLKPHIWWAWHSLRYEVADWAEAALVVQPEPAFARTVAQHLMTHSGRFDEALRIAEGLGDEPGTDDPDAICQWAWAHFNEAIIRRCPEMMRWMARWADAARATGNVPLAATSVGIEVVFRVMFGEMDEARRIAAESFDKARESGNQAAICWAHHFMGRAHSDREHRTAFEHFDRSVEIAARIGLPLHAGFAGSEAAAALAHSGESGRGRSRLLYSIRSFIDSGDWRQLWTSSHHLAYFLAREGRKEEARSVWCELGNRQGWAAKHHRDELEAMLGPSGESTLSDDAFVELVRGVLEQLGPGK